MTLVRWTVSIEGNRPDIERLVTAYPDMVAGDEPRVAVLSFEDDSDVPTDETRSAIRVEIETALRHINGAGKLRWGRAFEGVSIKRVEYVDATGQRGQVVFVGTAYAHLTVEEFGDMVERLGHPRPEPPWGADAVAALDVARVTDLADRDPTVARVLRLVDLMHDGDDEIDWSAGYSALETIETDAPKRERREWYSGKRRTRFTQTANSIEAVGIKARHGHPFDAPKKPMSRKEASWFIRGVAAEWLAWRLTKDPSQAE